MLQVFSAMEAQRRVPKPPQSQADIGCVCWGSMPICRCRWSQTGMLLLALNTNWVTDLRFLIIYNINPCHLSCSKSKLYMSADVPALSNLRTACGLFAVGCIAESMFDKQAIHAFLVGCKSGLAPAAQIRCSFCAPLREYCPVVE